MNVRFGIQSRHYGVALLFALFEAAVALRQIVLHVVPDSGGYGSTILGLHLHSDSFLSSVMVVGVAVLLFMEGASTEGSPAQTPDLVSKLAGATLLMLLLANLFSVLDVCQFGPCQDNPRERTCGSQADCEKNLVVLRGFVQRLVLFVRIL